jgi:hypothetical protein
MSLKNNELAQAIRNLKPYVKLFPFFKNLKPVTKPVSPLFSPKVIISAIVIVVLGALTFGLVWFFIQKKKNKKRLSENQGFSDAFFYYQ